MGSQEMVLRLRASVFKGGKCLRGAGTVVTQAGIAQESVAQPEGDSGDPQPAPGAPDNSLD